MGGPPAEWEALGSGRRRAVITRRVARAQYCEPQIDASDLTPAPCAFARGVRLAAAHGPLEAILTRMEIERKRRISKVPARQSEVFDLSDPAR